MTSRFKAEALWPNSTGVAQLSSFDPRVHRPVVTGGGGGFLSKSTAAGFRVSVLSLLEYFTKELQFRYFMTAHLSLDPIQNLFGIVRQSSGCNFHPTPKHFLITVDCLCFYSLAKPVTGANVAPTVLTALLDTSAASSSHSKDLQATLGEYISQGNLDELEIAVSPKPSAFPVEHYSLAKKTSDTHLVYRVWQGMSQESA